MTARLAFWLLAGTTVAVYFAMVLVTLPAIQAAAGGLPPFDMRPAGYSFEEAKAFLAALGPDGKATYLGAQRWLDIFFPGLIAATLAFALAALLKPWLGRGRWLVAALAVFVALFDWLENAAVAGMLRAGADGITPEMVADANRWTLLKSGVSTVVYTAVLVLVLVSVWRRWRHSRAGNPS